MEDNDKDKEEEGETSGWRYRIGNQLIVGSEFVGKHYQTIRFVNSTVFVASAIYLIAISSIARRYPTGKLS